MLSRLRAIAVGGAAALKLLAALIAAFALAPHAHAQQQIICNVSTATPCNPNTNPGSGTQGMPAWQFNGITNQNNNTAWAILQPTLTGIVQTSGNSNTTTAGAAFSAAPVTTPSGTTSQTLAARFSENFDLADVTGGVDNTGVADASVAIHTALVAASANSQCVVVPPGTYRFIASGALFPPGASCLKAQQPGTVTFINDAGNTDSFGSILKIHSNVTYAWVEGITFDGGFLAGVTVNAPVIQCASASNVTLYNNKIQNTFGFVVGLVGCTDSSFKFNRLDSNGCGVVRADNPGVYFNSANTTTYASGNSSIGNLITHPCGSGIEFQGQDNFLTLGDTVIGANNGIVTPANGGGAAGIYGLGNILPANKHTRIVADHVYGMTGNGFDINCGSAYEIGGNGSHHNGHAGFSFTSNTTNSCNISDIAFSADNTAKDNNQALAEQVTLVTNGATASGNTTLHFASTTGAALGNYVIGTNIQTGSYVITPFNATAATITCGTPPCITGGGVSNGASIIFSTYPTSSQVIVSGVYFGVSPSASGGSISNVSMGGGIFADDQITPTQEYGITTDSSTTLANIRISPTTIYYGNITAALGPAFLPSVTSGLGTSPIVSATSPFYFVITAGSGSPGTTTVLAMPPGWAASSWVCGMQDQTSAVTARQSGTNNATVATFTWSSAPTAADIISVNCGPN